MLSEFIETDEGQESLYDLIMSGFGYLDFKKLFPTGFMATLNFLIITPQNIGVLTPAGGTKIINEDFLRHLLEASDGDSVYLKHYFEYLNEILDDSYKVLQEKFHLHDLDVIYDVPALKHLIGFEKNAYLSDGLLKKYERESLTDGYRFY